MVFSCFAVYMYWQIIHRLYHILSCVWHGRHIYIYHPLPLSCKPWVAYNPARWPQTARRIPASGTSTSPSRRSPRCTCLWSGTDLWSRRWTAPPCGTARGTRAAWRRTRCTYDGWWTPRWLAAAPPAVWRWLRLSWRYSIVLGGPT